VVGDEGEIEAFHHLFLVEVGVKGEVVLLDGLGPGESCGLHGCVDPPLLLGCDLFLQEMIQEGQVRAGVLFRLLHHVIEDLGGNPVQITKGPDVAVQEGLQGAALHKLSAQGLGKAQENGKQVDGRCLPIGFLNLEIAPVYLGLVAGQPRAAGAFAPRAGYWFRGVPERQVARGRLF
jgi:hypothetical protein